MSWWGVVQRRFLSTSSQVDWPCSFLIFCVLFMSVVFSVAAYCGLLVRCGAWCIFFLITSCTYCIPRSVCKIALETYHGATVSPETNSVPFPSPLTTRRDYGGSILTRLHTGSLYMAVRFSALRTGRALLPQNIFLWLLVLISEAD
jgi:hypothetical protein